MSLRILVVDDQTMVRGALAALLSLEPDIEVCGQAGNGREALEVLGGIACSQDSAPAGAACTRPVDVVLLDVEMPVMDGIAACEAIRTRFPGTRVLMLTTFGRPGYVQRSLDAGASGFIVKDAPPNSSPRRFVVSMLATGSLIRLLPWKPSRSAFHH